MLTTRKISHQLYCISWVLLIAFAIGIIVSPTLKMIESLSMAVSILSIWMLTTVKFYENYRRNLLKSLTEKERKEYMIRELTADYKVSREDAEAILKKTGGAYALQDNLGQDAVSFAKFKHSWP